MSAQATAPAPRPLADIRRDIVHEVTAAENDFSSFLTHAVRAGELLNEAKAQVEHGDWLPWLRENFPDSRRTAQRYMRLAENATRLAHLHTVSEAVAFLAGPAPGGGVGPARSPQQPQLWESQPRFDPRPRNWANVPMPRMMAEGPLHAEGDWPARRSELVRQAFHHAVGRVAEVAIELAELGPERDRMAREEASLIHEAQVYVDRVTGTPWALVNGDGAMVDVFKRKDGTDRKRVEPGELAPLKEAG